MKLSQVRSAAYDISFRLFGDDSAAVEIESIITRHAQPNSSEWNAAIDPRVQELIECLKQSMSLMAGSSGLNPNNPMVCRWEQAILALKKPSTKETKQ
jgi:hypothetical protein